MTKQSIKELSKICISNIFLVLTVARLCRTLPLISVIYFSFSNSFFFGLIINISRHSHRQISLSLTNTRTRSHEEQESRKHKISIKISITPLTLFVKINIFGKLKVTFMHNETETNQKQ